MKAPRYYTLAVRMNGEWSPEFGDFDRETVQIERNSYRQSPMGFAAKDLMILISGDSQDEINDAIASLNGRG